MTICNVIGGLMMLAFFAGIFVIVAVVESWRASLMLFGAVCLLLAWIAVATFLMGN